MDLFLLRHGLAATLEQTETAQDKDRPLTAEGVLKIERTARLLRQLGLRLDRILSSPYLRARHTAEIVAEALDATNRLELTSDLLSLDSAPRLLASLRAVPAESVLLVGHEPCLSQLISVLLAGHPGLPITMKKGALAKLSVSTPAFGPCATLDWLLPPKLALQRT